jgi:hypothetical protein
MGGNHSFIWNGPGRLSSGRLTLAGGFPSPRIVRSPRRFPQHAVRRQGQGAVPDTGGMPDRVRDRGGGADDAQLADAFDPQRVDWTALRTGLSWLILNLPFLVMAQFTGRLSRRLPARAIAAGGCLVTAVGILTLSTVTPSSPFIVTVIGYVLFTTGNRDVDSRSRQRRHAGPAPASTRRNSPAPIPATCTAVTTCGTSASSSSAKAPRTDLSLPAGMTRIVLGAVTRRRAPRATVRRSG